MDHSFSPSEVEFRAEVRAWLAEHVPNPPLPSGDTREGFALHLEWERKLFDARYAVVSWPSAFGGRDASLWEWIIFEEEYWLAGAPQRVTQNGIFLLAPTIFEFGTPEQQQRILPKMASGEESWCQGWSEPNAGSDLAGLSSRAVRDDAAGGWRLNGQKTWTTRGAFCTHLFGLFRTDPDAARHSGMTYLLVDLRQPGITVRPVERLDGDEGFAEVFFDDARKANALLDVTLTTRGQSGGNPVVMAGVPVHALESYLGKLIKLGEAVAIAEQVGIETDEYHVRGGVLPHEKVNVIREIQERGYAVAMVGDGVNDAAALAQADVGIAMGTGTDVAMQASDLTIVSGDLRLVVDAIRLSRATLRTIKANVFWAFAYNVAAIPLAAAGMMNPMWAGLAMASSSVFVVTNSLRLRRVKLTH